MSRPFNLLTAAVVFALGCVDEPSLNEACDYAATTCGEDRLDYGECVDDVLAHLKEGGSAAIVDMCIFESKGCDAIEGCLDFPESD